MASGFVLRKQLKSATTSGPRSLGSLPPTAEAPPKHSPLDLLTLPPLPDCLAQVSMFLKAVTSLCHVRNRQPALCRPNTTFLPGKVGNEASPWGSSRKTPGRPSSRGQGCNPANTYSEVRPITLIRWYSEHLHSRWLLAARLTGRTRGSLFTELTNRNGALARCHLWSRSSSWVTLTASLRHLLVKFCNFLTSCFPAANFGKQFIFS